MVNHKSTFSFIIVTWNTADITKKCIDTVNKYIPDQEIIVVDNGSSDNTIELIKPIKNVVLIENKSNLGFSKANNIGLKSATSDYIVFMNSDMELIDNSLLSMLDYFKNNPKIGIIGPQFLNPDNSIQASIFPKQSIVNAFKEFWLDIPNQYSKYNPKSTNPQKVWSISGGFILTRKDFFESVGRWDEKYFFYFEDMDLSRKVNKANKDVYFYPECKVIHRHGASGHNLATFENQWKRLIPGSKMYHGLFRHYAINFIIWSGQKRAKLLSFFRH